MEGCDSIDPIPNKRQKRINATYAWLLCCTRMDFLPREMVMKIARYVNGQKDDEVVTRTYVHVKDRAIRAYDSNSDNFVLYKPKEKPYYVLEIGWYRCRDVIIVRDRKVAKIDTFTHVLKHAKTRFLSEEEFERLRNNGVAMFEGSYIDEATGKIQKNQTQWV